MTFQTPTWQRQTLTCECGKPFKPNYRNGILISHKCPNCNLRASQKQVKPKNNTLYGSGVKGGSEAKKQPTPRQKMMKKADNMFSKYIRLKFSFMSGGELFCRCIISGRIFGIKHIDNGHCFSRAFKSTRFEEDNCRPQNGSSNRFSGEADHYKFIKNLKAEIGEERFAVIEKLKDQECHDSETFYRLQFETYKHLFNELLNERRWEDPWKKKK